MEDISIANAEFVLVLVEEKWQGVGKEGRDSCRGSDRKVISSISGLRAGAASEERRKKQEEGFIGGGTLVHCALVSPWRGLRGLEG